MRSFGSTYLGLDFSVVSFTKEIIAFLAGPSFQDGRGSRAWALAAANMRIARIAALKPTCKRMGFFILVLLEGDVRFERGSRGRTTGRVTGGTRLTETGS